MTTKVEQLEKKEKLERDAIHHQVVVPNKEKNFHIENTRKLNKARDIYKSSDRLDNISGFNMEKFNEIMLG